MNNENALSEAVAIPDHIPESLVYDFDMFHDPAYNADPHERVLDLLENAPPVFWTPRNGGRWILLGYAANFDAARDTEVFSSESVPHAQLQELLAQLPPETGHIPLPYPIMLDPPLHTKYRQPLQRIFSPKTINALEARIRELARELIDGVAKQGSCEFMSAIAEPLPVMVFLKLLGLPVEKLGEYRALLKEQMSLSKDQSDQARNLANLQNVTAAMRDTLLARREKPQDDIISHLWNTEIDGRALTLEEMENYGVLLFIAGLDTVMQSMGYALRHMAIDQDLQAGLRASPELTGEAIEEILRRYTFALPVRRVTRDIEFRGVQMKANEIAVLFLHGANLDSAQFEDPERVDVARENKAHIAFNAGPHRCLGSHLARLELRILYEEFLARIPRFQLDPQRPPIFDCGHVVCVDTLNLVWNV